MKTIALVLCFMCFIRGEAEYGGEVRWRWGKGARKEGGGGGGRGGGGDWLLKTNPFALPSLYLFSFLFFFLLSFKPPC